MCITCGHCVAACPHDASPLIQKELSVGIDQVEQFLRSLRSIRAFKDKPVEKETVQHLIEIARYAPTGENAQAINWMVCTDPAEIKKPSEMTFDWMRHMLDKEPENPRTAWRIYLSRHGMPPMMRSCTMPLVWLSPG